MTDTLEDQALPAPPEQDHLKVGGHRMAAMDAQIAADFAGRWRDGQLRAAARVIERAKARTTGTVPLDQRDKVADYLSRADVNAQRAERYREIRDHHLRVAVKAEPRTYGPGNPQNSYLLDLARVAVPELRQDREARARLDRHGLEVAFECRQGTAEGERAIRSVGTWSRERGDLAVIDEQRAMTSLSGSGGAFVTPQHLVTDYGVYRSYPASFFEQTTKVPDVGYGLTLYIPAFTSAATAGEQGSENAGVDATPPGAAYLSGQLVTYAGEIDVSQQLFDRAGPVHFDQVAYAALRASLMSQVDSGVLTVALATAGTVSGASSFTAAALYGDVAKAKSQIATAGGVKLPATHVFLQPSFGEWALAQADPNGRPLFLPTPAGVALPFSTDPSSPALGYSGTRLLGTSVFEDGEIPSSGSTTRIVVANMGEVFTVMSEPVLRAFHEPLAESLTVVIQCYSLVGTIVRHHSAVQVITGNAYPASPSFA